jgi:hypothetical protein
LLRAISNIDYLHCARSHVHVYKTNNLASAATARTNKGADTATATASNEVSIDSGVSRWNRPVARADLTDCVNLVAPVPS